MSSNLAYRYLEQIQAETYDALDIKIQNALQDPRVLPGYRRIVREFLTAQAGHPVTEQQVEKQLQIYLEQQRDRMKTAPTRFEESNTFSIMSQLNEQIDTVIATHQIPLSAKPIFGTLSTGRVNAVTVAVPRAGGYLVLLERQLFFFALLIGKAVALTFAIESGKDDEPASVLLNRDAAAARLDADDTPIRRFLETVSAYATTGVPTNAPPYVLSDHRYQALSGMLCEAMELFVLGHEYGHVIAGHLDSTRRHAGLLPTNTPTEELEYAWRQEYEADFLGIQLSAAAQADSVDFGVRFTGGELFFSSMEIMDKAVSVLQFGEESARVLGTHPPHGLRREALRHGLRQMLDAAPADTAVAFALAIEDALSLLWERSRDTFLQMHRSGVRPARSWHSAMTVPSNDEEKR